MDRSWAVALLFVSLSLSAAQDREAVPRAGDHPIERGLRAQFPSIAWESKSEFAPAQRFIAGAAVSGMAVARKDDVLQVFYPDTYDETFVAELAEQRVVLRPKGARFAAATPAAGKIFYGGAYESVDAIEVPRGGRNEELLLLHDARAPRLYEYEIVEMRGVDSVSVRDGAVLFFPDRLDVPSLEQRMGGRFVPLRPMLQIDRPWVIDAQGNRSELAAQWHVVLENGRPRAIRLTVDAQGLAFPLIVDPSFSRAGSMSTTRESASATLLPNGKVLIAGGYNSLPLQTAELYDPATGTFTATGNMVTARVSHTATLLANGKVLVAGGSDGVSTRLSSAELYDPVSGTFTATGSMTATRDQHTATLLSNGKLLIAGGFDGTNALSTAELYDPATNTFTATGNMRAARDNQTATLLPSGKVLIAGGAYSRSAELYDPATSTFALSSGGMSNGRSFHTATLLPTGKVLIAGGYNGSTLNAAELYDPAVDTFSPTASMATARKNHSATLLPDAQVLITGGYNGAYLQSGEVYDPRSGTFAAAGAMISARMNQTATLLPAGTVLLAGGFNGAYLATAEIYQYAAGSFAATGAMAEARSNHTSTLLPGGTVLVAGGGSCWQGGPVSSYSKTATLYDPATRTFTSTGDMFEARSCQSATLLANGKVLIAGGTRNTNAELYGPASGTFTSTANTMIYARENRAATLLPDGRVLFTGGNDGFSNFLDAEVYDPATDKFALTGSMTVARSGHTATLLADGKVLIAGGTAGSPTAELYDPASGTFTATTGSMTVARSHHTATLLPTGQVLIAGGMSLTSAEIYNPPTGTFTATSGSMSVARADHSAALLPDGTVLITGGSSTSLVAEVYDPRTALFSATASMTTARQRFGMTPLPNGTVLLDGGTSSLTAELYDAGLGYSNGRRPVVSTITNPVCQPATLALTGSLFTGDSEGSSGATNNSASNAPLLRLLRVDNEQRSFAPLQSFSASTFSSATLQNFPSGHYRVAIVSNAIPSQESIIEIATTPLLGSYGAASVPLGTSATIPPSSLPAGYKGALYAVRATASTGFTGTLSVSSSSGAVNVTNAGPKGSYTITVTSLNDCGSPTTTFSLDVTDPPGPTNVVATATATTTVSVSWSATPGVTYEVLRLGAGGVSTTVGTSTSGSLTDTTATAGKAYLYKVRGIAPNITAYSLPDLATTILFTDPIVNSGDTVKAVHFSELRPAVNEVRQLANLAIQSFTDATLTPGVTVVKAVHLIELRSALDEARSALGLTAVGYNDPTITAGVTLITFRNITQLRAGVQ